MYEVDKLDDDDVVPDDDDDNEDSDDDQVMYTSVRKQITSRSVCGVCGGRGHFGRVEGMDCLTKQLGIVMPRSELSQTKYPSGITFPFSNTSASSSASHRRPTQGASFASSSSLRRSGKSKHPNRKPSPKPHKPSHRHKPRRVSQVDEQDSEHVEHEEHEEQDEKLSDSDARVDFATLAVSYSTIETRHNNSDSYDSESSEDSRDRRATRRL